MRKLLLSLCLVCALPACAAYSTLPTPSTVANQTKLDEQIAVTAHLAYKSWRIAVETGVNAGTIKGKLAGQIAGLDNQLYAALTAVDTAYAAGNATDYSTAVANFNTALTVGYSAIGGR